MYIHACFYSDRNFSLRFAAFLECTHQLSEMKSYRQLQQRADRIGYSISKVVYRGYHASDQLQVNRNASSTVKPLLGEHQALKELSLPEREYIFFLAHEWSFRTVTCSEVLYFTTLYFKTTLIIGPQVFVPKCDFVWY